MYPARPSNQQQSHGTASWRPAVRTHLRPITGMWIAASLVAAACGSAAPTPSAALAGLAQQSAKPTSEFAAPASTDAGIPALADVPYYRADVLGSAIEPGPGPAATPALAWQAKIGRTHWAPILVDGLLITTAIADDVVVALDARTGETRWRFQLAQPYVLGENNGAAAASDGLLFVSDSSTGYARDPITGMQRWSTPVPNKGERPLVVGGVVFAGAIGGAVGLDEKSGAVVWRWKGPADVPMLVGSIADGTAYISSMGDGRVYAVRLNGAGDVWQYQTRGPVVSSCEVIGDTG